MPDPNFFIVGAAKSGTTSLYNYLNEHPEVYMSPIKEPQHFGTDISGESFGKFNSQEYFQHNPLPQKHIANVKDEDDYQRLFAYAGNAKGIGEASTAYLYSDVAASEIKERYPDAKIIISLRNPIDRAFSHYQMNVQAGITKDTFIDAVKKDLEKKEKGWGVSNLYIEIGQYFKQVKRYLDNFGSDNVKIIIFEELIADTRSTMEDLFRFLEIDENSDIDYSQQHLVGRSPRSIKVTYALNKFGAKKIKDILPEEIFNKISHVIYKNRKKEITEEERKYISGLYEEDIKKLSKLINNNFSLWQKKH